jgi:outer membrane lipoprotein-sorting protein
MSEHQNEQFVDLVSQAVAATRELPIPDGPSPDVVLRTRAALHETANRPVVSFTERINHMPTRSKVIGILSLAASVLVVFVGLSLLMGGGLAFADVVQTLNKVRSARWKITTEVKRSPSETLTTTGVGMFLAPSRERTETTVGDQKTIFVVDGQRDKLLSLYPAMKTATVIDLKNLPQGRENPFGKTFQGLRLLVATAQDGTAGEVERLGATTIDGRAAEGFRIKFGAIEAKIWADPKTWLPIRVEESMTGEQSAHIVMSDFQVDVEMDEALFSLDVPEGYVVEQTAQLDLSKKPIEILADALKVAAEFNDGVFPPTLRGEKGIDGMIQQAAKKMAEEAAKDPAKLRIKANELAMKVGGAFGVVFALTPDNDWHYTGKDVKINTPDRPIFWYKAGKGSTTYQVLYADLTVKEVPAAEAPKDPAVQGGLER